MVILEALNALAGDCLLLRYPGPDGKERLWLIDGGPKADRMKESRSGRMFCCLGCARSIQRCRCLSPSDGQPHR